MSWIEVQGKVYHCLECNRRLQIEYQGGLQATHVSDLVVWEQMRLAARHPGSPTYLLEEGLCSPCVERRAATTGRRAAAARIALLLRELHALATRDQDDLVGDQLSEQVSRWIEALDPQPCREPAPDAVRGEASGPGPKHRLLVHRDVSARESLNPFLEYELSVRSPLDGPAEAFFVFVSATTSQVSAMLAAMLPQRSLPRDRQRLIHAVTDCLGARREQP